MCIESILKQGPHQRKCPNCRKGIQQSDIIDIVYNIDDCQENIVAQQEASSRENALKKAQSEIKKLEHANILNEKKILQERDKLKKIEEQIESDIPDKVIKLSAFPNLKNEVRITYDLVFKDIGDLRVHAPKENEDSPKLGPFASEDKSYAYEGQYLNKKRHGVGKIYFRNGKFYSGTWVNDTMFGYGLLIKSDGTYIKGYFKNNHPDGYAEYIRPGKESYIGYWKEGKKHGKGEEIIPEGTNYNGEYFYGKKHGIATCLFPDHKKYEGQFQNGNITGKGKMTWPDGKTYEGQWIDGKMEGEGTFLWTDGRIYVGNYLRGEKHGFGKLTYLDGSRYEGNFEHGKQHGVGKCIHKDGTIEDVLCTNGTFKPRSFNN